MILSKEKKKIRDFEDLLIQPILKHVKRLDEFDKQHKDKRANNKILIKLNKNKML